MMERMDYEPPMSIAEHAAEWLLRWHCGDLSIAERFEYLQWLKTSPVHIAETLRMCRLYAWLEASKLQLFVTNEESCANVVELPPSDVQHIDPFEVELARLARTYPVDTDTLVRNAREALAARRRWRWRAAAATVAAVTLAVWLLRTIVSVQGMETATQAGEWRALTLADGTEVTLGPNSRVRRDDDETRRGVLLESGEAFFKVAKDPRPFLADVQERVTARALGTEFGISIDRSDGTVTVTVQEGTVAVSLHDHPAEPLAVAAGEQLQIENYWPVAPRRIDPARELAWTRKRLKFDAGDTLGSAVKEFNRRNEIQIKLDQSLAGRPIRGEFHANDPLSFAESAARQAGVVLTRSADTVRLEVKGRPPDALDPGARNDG